MAGEKEVARLRGALKRVENAESTTEQFRALMNLVSDSVHAALQILGDDEEIKKDGSRSWYVQINDTLDSMENTFEDLWDEDQRVSRR